MASSASVTRALNVILPLIASGQPYEAHQKARTFASRYSKSGQFDTAIQVLFQSARELLKTGQQGSGTDLTTFLLEVYESKGEEVNEESRGASFPAPLDLFVRCVIKPFFWAHIVSYFRTPHSTYRSDRTKRSMEENDNRQIHSVGHWSKPCSLSNLLYSNPLITTAHPITFSTVLPLRWTARKGPWPTGDPDLQHYVGELLYKGTTTESVELSLTNCFWNG